MKFTKFIIAILVLNVSAMPVFADNEAINNMVDANDYIVGYKKAVKQAKKISSVPVEFPAFIPKPESDKKYYASIDEKVHEYGFEHWINIDYTPDCHGVKVCNAGIISARKIDKIEMMEDRNNKLITKPVMLADGIDAYFTPGHPMGDFFPGNIQWKDGKAVYSMSWRGHIDPSDSERDVLVTMANSAKHPGLG